MTDSPSAGASAPASEAVPPKSLISSAVAEEFKLLADHLVQRAIFRASQVDDLIAQQARLVAAVGEQDRIIAELRSAAPEPQPEPKAKPAKKDQP